ncbi:MAG: hypothetical protein KDD34_06165, partial [Bdellovibrionales bacterium]|nr:hypothetical protein [Bdellovibrionales bacterium]
THAGQTMVIIWVIQVIAIVKEEIERAKLMGKTVDWEETKEMIVQAAEHMVNDPQIYLGMMGASAVGTSLHYGDKYLKVSKAFQESGDLLSQTLKSSVSRAHFKTLISSGAMSLITFMGWEAGSQLWEEALLDLGSVSSSDPEVQKQLLQDLQTAKDIKYTKMIKSLWDHDAVSDEERRVFGLMLQNMGSILLNNDGKRWQWFYNTWRKRIATGDFVLLVAAMAAGGWAGTQIGLAVGTPMGLPGWIVMGFFGLAGGVVGGALTIFVPQWMKDAMTEYIRDIRIDNAENYLRENKASELHKIKIFTGDSRKNRILRALSFQSFETLLQSRRKARDRYMNAWIERYHNAILKKQFAQYENMIGAMRTDPEMNQKLQALIAGESHEDIAGTSLQEFIQTHEQEINGLLDDIDVKNLNNSIVEKERAKVIDSNRNDIVKAEKLIQDSIQAFSKFYAEDAETLANTYIAETWDSKDGDKLPKDMDDLVQKEIGYLTKLHKNIMYVVLGFNPDLSKSLPQEEQLSAEELKTLEGPARILLNLYFEYGYHEKEVLNTLTQAENQLAHNK